MSFAERLKELRKQRGLSQKALSEEIGLSERRYISLETEETKPSFETFLKLSEFFNVTLDYLVGKTDDNPVPPTEAPRVFISYSWTSPEYIDRVMRLATYLSESGLDVVLDQWDLKPGHDINTFIERSIEDAKYVLVLCDENSYKEKADNREGGVGKETYLIAGKVYKDPKQEKFIPVVMERDDDFSEAVPAYLKDRFFFDLSFDEEANRRYLLRHLFGEPRRKKPKIGSRPDFSAQDEHPFDVPSNAAVLKAIADGKNNILFLAGEFLEKSVESLEQYKITDDSDAPIHERVIERIDQMAVVRDSILDVVIKLVKYPLPSEETMSLLHGFFEKVWQYTRELGHSTGYRYAKFDNYAFLLYELFLYTLAACLKYEKFTSLPVLLADYLDPEKQSEPLTQAWAMICPRLGGSLGEWNKKQERHWISPEGNFMQSRATRKDVQWLDILQADAFLFIGSKGQFFPWTYPYMSRAGVLPLFARATSRQYALKFLPVLGFNRTDEFKVAVYDMIEQTRSHRSFFECHVRFEYICNLDHIGERP